MSDIKAILLPFNNIQPSDAIVDTAFLIATRFGSYIEGIHYRQLLPIIAGEGITLPGDYMAGFEEDARMQAEMAELAFKKMIEDRDIPFGALDESSNVLRAGWHHMIGTDSLGVGEYARLFDLSIVERHAAETAINWKTTAETILFESGRPIIVINNHAPKVLGNRILIAWNGSTEATRSVSAAMPFLERSEDIVILSVNGGVVSGPDGEQLSKYLSARGIVSEHKTIDTSDSSVGKAILEFAEDWKCDLLVKGAYTQSRLRQLVFGGPTRQIIENSSIPALVSH
jgi:nucleotide-binding universal stress UspA family protein